MLILHEGGDVGTPSVCVWNPDTEYPAGNNKRRELAVPESRALEYFRDFCFVLFFSEEGGERRSRAHDSDKKGD